MWYNLGKKSSEDFSSCLVSLDKTKSKREQLISSCPLIPKRILRGEKPISSITCLTPLWPPADLPWENFTLPNGKFISSCTKTRLFSGFEFIQKNLVKPFPLRFMNERDLRSKISLVSHLKEETINSLCFWNVELWAWASLSTNQWPKLCLVPKYLLPGFPNPRMISFTNACIAISYSPAHHPKLMQNLQSQQNLQPLRFLQYHPLPHQHDHWHYQHR